MSIFDGKHKTQAEEMISLTPLEQELAQKLAEAGVLEDIDRFVEEKAAELEWIVNCQSYYETRRRIVRIHEDLLQIAWNEAHTETMASGNKVTIFDVNESVEMHYTDYGFCPLHSHLNERGNEDVTIDTILFMWGIIVRDHMKEKLPQCEFSPVFQSIGEATFSFTVPEQAWSDWF